MNICPECGNIITYLIVNNISYKNYLMIDKSKILIDYNLPEDETIIHCSCPKCEYLLFEDDLISAKQFIEKI